MTTQPFVWKTSNDLYRLYYYSGGGAHFYEFVVGGNKLVLDYDFSSPLPLSWHMVTCWFDSTTGGGGIALNNQAPVTGTALSTVTLEFAYFQLGANNGSANSLNGLLDMVSLHPYVLSSNERTYLYNNGSGRIGRLLES